MLPLVVATSVAVLWPPAAAAWSWPVEGPVLRGFSLGADPYAAGRHRGIDVGAAVGAGVTAPVGGEVSFAGPVPGGGVGVTIRTADGLSVTLLQLGSAAVRRGEAVGERDVVGRVGPSADPVTAVPHVHLGVRIAAEAEGYLDPLLFLPRREPAAAAGTAGATTSAAQPVGTEPAVGAREESIAAPAAATPATPAESAPVSSVRVDVAPAPPVEQAAPSPAAEALPAPPLPPALVPAPEQPPAETAAFAAATPGVPAEIAGLPAPLTSAPPLTRVSVGAGEGIASDPPGASAFVVPPAPAPAVSTDAAHAAVAPGEAPAVLVPAPEPAESAAPAAGGLTAVPGDEGRGEELAVPVREGTADITVPPRPSRSHRAALASARTTTTGGTRAPARRGAEPDPDVATSRTAAVRARGRVRPAPRVEPGRAGTSVEVRRAAGRSGTAASTASPPEQTSRAAGERPPATASSEARASEEAADTAAPTATVPRRTGARSHGEPPVLPVLPALGALLVLGGLRRRGPTNVTPAGVPPCAGLRPRRRRLPECGAPPHPGPVRALSAPRRRRPAPPPLRGQAGRAVVVARRRRGTVVSV